MHGTDAQLAYSKCFHGVASAWCPAMATLFHVQEWNVATEPSLWPSQLYGTVYQQQFVKLSLTACICLSAELICLLYVLMTDWLSVFIYFTNSCTAFPVWCWA